MISAIFVITADTHLGRVDLESLPDQTLMEMLFQDFNWEAQAEFQDNNGMYIDVCQWPGVECGDLGRVVRITRRTLTAGTIYLSFIPSKVERFIMQNACLAGTLETNSLPHSMEVFNIGKNAFEGNVDFTTLPESLVSLRIHSNKFTGSADLRKLPQTVHLLEIHDNKFTGSVSLKSLPAKIESMSISLNNFSGEFCLENAPLPMRSIYAEQNRFDATAVVPKDKFANLWRSGVAHVVDERGEKHPYEHAMCNVG